MFSIIETQERSVAFIDANSVMGFSYQPMKKERNIPSDIYNQIGRVRLRFANASLPRPVLPANKTE
jgi:hypothetical protein